MAEQRNLQKTVKRIILLIGIGLVAHLIFLLFTTDKNTFTYLRKISFGHFILISLCALGPWLGHSLRIMLWSKFVKYPIGFKDSLSVVVTNDIGSALAPALVGGGPLKLVGLINKGMDSTKATFLVLLSATEDLVFYAFGFGLSAYFMKANILKLAVAMFSNKLVLVFLIGSGILIAVSKIFKFNISSKVLGLFSKKIQTSFSNRYIKFKDSLSQIKLAFRQIFKEGKIQLLISLFLLFFQWISKFTILIVIMAALGISFSISDVYIKQWLISMGMLIVPTPGGSGGAEAAFLLLFDQFLDNNLDKLLVSIWRFFTYYFILMLAVVLYQYFYFSDKKANTI